MIRVHDIAIGLFAFGLGTASANAAVITLNDTFSASGFGAGAPFDPVTGEFSITFDNLGSFKSTAATISSNVSLTGASAVFNYEPIGECVHKSDYFVAVL